MNDDYYEAEAQLELNHFAAARDLYRKAALSTEPVREVVRSFSKNEELSLYGQID